MILPANYSTTLILLIVGMLCWGAWANMLKSADEKWRFEFFYFDFAIGMLLAATIIALTFGNLGFDGFSFIDDVRLAGKRQEFFALIAGMIFNLGNMLLVGAVSVSGIAVAFPAAMGLALVVGTLWSFFLGPEANNAVLLFAGAAVVAGAVVVDAMAWRAWSLAKLMDQIAQGKTRSTKKNVSLKAIGLSVAGGWLIGSYYPLIQMARAGENGLGPYSIGFIFAVGVFFSTFVYNLFFMNLPVKGEPADITDYFRIRIRRHLTGVLGGTLWYAGGIAYFIGGRVEGAARVAPSASYALGQGATVVSVLCGLLIWKEFAGADFAVKTWLGLMLVLFILGIGLVSSAALVPAS